MTFGNCAPFAGGCFFGNRYLMMVTNSPAAPCCWSYGLAFAPVNVFLGVLRSLVNF